MEFKFVRPEAHNVSLYNLDQINFKYLFQNTFIKKLYFTLSKKTKLGEKEFLKSYIVFLKAQMTCTIKSSQTDQAAGAS